MRIWDIHPGYLNRQSLLGEHRELHGIVSIIANNKKGYSKHPETLRWVNRGWALKQRHRLLAAEMSLRGYHDRSPVSLRSNKELWPETYIDEPFRQFQLLASKYHNREPGRIPLPDNAQQFWSQHKYSVLARNESLYRKLGRDFAAIRPRENYSALATTVTEQLRISPTPGGINNALLHMWGYVSDAAASKKNKIETWSSRRLLKTIQQNSLLQKQNYIISSTALTELEIWIPG
ncbi:MAG: DUF1722 domain-containing protein [Gammaproteobacteria bacterium]|nr:DUF1722 domain-containing protein [Gammaproteobacteria bacterium]